MMPYTGTNSIVVAQPRTQLSTLLRQANQILHLKRRMKREVHYGAPYPGSKKETLLKPGAELLARAFGLRPHYECLTERIDVNTERPDLSFVMYRYRCVMIDIATGKEVGEAIGSCSSMEDKFHWRWVAEALLPSYYDKTALESRNGGVFEPDFAIDKAETTGKYGKPAEYWKSFRDAITNGSAKRTKKKMGAKEFEGWEIGGLEYRVPHANPLDLMNTIDKMAQKRSNVTSTNAAIGGSAYFSPGDEEVTDIYATDDMDVIDVEFEDVGAPDDFPDDVQVYDPPPVQQRQASKPTPPIVPMQQPAPEPQKPPAPVWPSLDALNILLGDIRTRTIEDMTASEYARLAGISAFDNLDEWKAKYPKGADVRPAVLATFKESMEKPAQPKSQPPAHVWTEDDLSDLEEHASVAYLLSRVEALALVGKSAWSDFSDPDAARTTLKVAVIDKGLRLVANKAHYVKSGNSGYTEFIDTPLPVRLYGTSEVLKKLINDNPVSPWLNIGDRLKAGETVELPMPISFEWEKAKTGGYSTAKPETVKEECPF